MNKNQINNTGFTLAEVLIVLTIIGVVAAMVIPVIIQKTQEQEITVATKKTYSILNNALQQTIIDNGNSPYNCYYNMSGTNHENTECTQFGTEFIKHFIVSKKCDAGRAITDRCIPQYKGNDNLYMEATPGATLADAQTAVAGCAGFNTASFNSKEAYVLNGGMILIPYSSLFQDSPHIFAVDSNGLKGPNKFGYDILDYYIKSDGKRTAFFADTCIVPAPGGHYADYYLKK